MENWKTGLQIADFSGLKPLLRSEAGMRGQCCAALLLQSGVWDLLAHYDAVVVGTIPLGLDLPGSDIDILLEITDPDSFVVFCDQNFASFDGYQSHYRAATPNVGAAIIVKLLLSDGINPPEQVEIFATSCPVEQQYGFRHMVVEARVLHFQGAKFAEKLRALKKTGLKTEPAFAALLGISGDPYLELAGLFGLSSCRLDHWLAARL